jgi:ABC-type multidrug transport system fused ATPase/permease subunit
VLIDLTLQIRAREKVGVVGRTGSGKSTMLAGKAGVGGGG